MFRANNEDKGATFGQRTRIVQSYGKCMDIFIVNFWKKRVFYIVFSVLTLSMLAPLGLSDKQNKQNLVIKIKQWCQ